MQYTEDFKRGIVRTLLASGMTRKEFAAKTKITVQALRKWVKQYKDEEIKNVDHNNRSKYSEEYKKSIVSKMLFDGITYETMSKKTGISSQLLEYWDNKYRYILIDEFEKRMANRRKKKVKKETRWRELPLPCGTVVPMEVASNSRDSYPFLTKRLAVRTNQGIFTYAAIPLTGIPFGFSLWNPYTSGAERNV